MPLGVRKQNSHGGGVSALKPWQKTLIIVGACVLGLAALLTGILVPTLGKDDGTTPVKKPHVCKNICVVCGKCTDLHCEDEKCADKCGGEKHSYAFEAEDALFGAGINGWVWTEQYGSRTAVAGLNKNKDASLTFIVRAEAATVASLVVDVSKFKDSRLARFTDYIGVTVNDGENLTSSTIISKTTTGDQTTESSFQRFNLGCVELKAGINLIKFTVLDNSENNAYIFDKIELLSDSALSAGHICTSVCPSCGKCTNTECTDEACAEKCDCVIADFEAENAIFVDGKPKWGYLEIASNDQGRTFVKNFNGNPGAVITFKFTVDGEPGTVYESDLYVTVTRFAIDTTFTDVLGVSINGGEYIKSNAVVSAFGGEAWSDESYGEFFIGKVALKAGENSISFTVLGENEYSGYNFDKITLRKAPPLAHECSDKCEICGGCTTDCDKPGCAEKCECDNITETVTIEAEDSAYADGENPPSWGGVHPETDGDVTFVAGFNGNVGAWIEFTYESAGERDALLFVTVNRRKVTTVFSDWITTRITYPDGTFVEPISTAVLDGYAWVGENDNEWKAGAFAKICIGKIGLKNGTNKIRFTVKTFDSVNDLGGYNFDKVTLELIGDAEPPVAVEHDIVVADNIQNGSVTASETKATAGTQITVTVTPDQGYVLKSLKFNGTDITESKTFVMPNADVTITAEFVDESAPPAAKYDLTFELDGGSGDIIGMEESYEEGAEITLPSGDGLTKDGSVFAGWTYNGTDYAAGDKFTMPANAVVFTAKWSAKIPDAVFEAEDAEYKDGANPSEWGGVHVEEIKVGETVTRKVVAGLNENLGAEVKFTVFVNGETDKTYSAALAVTISRNWFGNLKFTDYIGVKVNNEAFTSDVVVDGYWGDGVNVWSDDASYMEFVLGDIELKSGINTITFTTLSNENGKACNFDKMTLRNLSVAVTAPPTPQRVVLQAEDAVRVDGESPGQWSGVKIEEIETESGDKTGDHVVGGLNDNVGAYVEFTYESTDDREAVLKLRLNRRTVQTTFSDWVNTVVTYADGSSQTVNGDVEIGAYHNQWKAEAYIEIDLGKIQLKAGANKIRFTIKGYDGEKDIGGYNFDYISLEM